MPETSSSNRRTFVKLASSAVAASSMSSGLSLPANRAQANEPTKNPIAVFVKHVQTMPFDELAKRLQSIGVDGVEATLRPGGQIPPKQLSKKLGGYVDALGKQNQRVVIAASNVNEANQDSEAYLAELAKFKIPYLRMAYYKYDVDKPILPQLDQFAKTATEFAALCKSQGVTALYQNHAGRNYVGAALWDLLTLLKNIDPAHLAVAIDIRHTTLEMGMSYPVGYRAVKPHIGATYVKDFVWENGKAQNVPLGEGRSKPLFDLIKKDGFIGPLSLHMEYTDHRDPGAVEESWQAIASDVNVLHHWLRE